MKPHMIIAYITVATGLIVPDFAKREKISKQALYSAIKGQPQPKARKIIAEAIGKPESEIWPETTTNQEAA